MAQWQPAADAASKAEAPSEGLELSEDRWQLLPAEAAPEPSDDAPVPLASAWEFIQWQQPAAPAAPPEEPMPLAQSWEFVGWQPPPEPGTADAAASELPLPEASIAPLAEPLPAETAQATAPLEDEPPVPQHIAPELLAHERLVPEPIDDGSDTSPYGLHTVSPEEASAELGTEAPAAPPTAKPGEPE